MHPNLHTHTPLCRHAAGDPVEMARLAAQAGAKVLGISDHAALPDDRWLEVRMEYADLPRYEALIEAARRAEPGLTLLKGFEAEGDPALFDYYRYLLGERGFDYLVGAGHYLRLDGRWRSSFLYLNDLKSLSLYAEQVVGMIESGLFSFIAHPDLFGCGFDRWDENLQAASEEIAQAAAERGVPLELNGNGWRKEKVRTSQGERAPYPWRPFWEAAAALGAPVVVNSDAHHPSELFDGIEQGLGWARELGLKVWGPRELGLAKDPPLG